MKRIYKYLTLLCLSPITLSAQGENPPTFFREVENRLDSHQGTMPVEKLYVHQDRTQYVAGETIWFKVYQSSSPDYPVHSGVAYVDIINGNNETVIKTKWRLENGNTAGQVSLPDALAGGRYLLRAYTRWMLNFGTERFFTRELQIASLYRDSVADANEPPPPSIRLDFLPEGGHLVAGIPSRVAFKAIDNNGNGVDVKGVVVDQDGHRIRAFNTIHSGQGYFYLEPEPGKDYRAVLEGQTERIPLPEASPRGVVMEVRLRENHLRVTLRHNLESAGVPRPLYLTVHKEGQSWYNLPINMERQTSVCDIPYDMLPGGIFTITVYDENLYAYCERLAFVNYPKQLSLRLEPDRLESGMRQRMKVGLQVEKEVEETGIANFSVAVVKAGLDNVESRNNFYTDYFLKSELKGKIENPVSYFSDRDSTGIQKMDLLLLTHGWRRYAWEEIMNDLSPQEFSPVEPGLTLSGRIFPLTRRTKLDRAEVTAVFRQDSVADIMSFNPAGDGKFVVTDFHFHDTAEVVISGQDTRRRPLHIVLDRDSVPSSDYYVCEDHYPEENFDFNIEIRGQLPQISGTDMDKMTHQLPEVMVTARKKTPRDHRKLHSEVFNFATYKVKDRYSYTIGRGGDGALGILEFIPKAKALESPAYFLDGMRVPEEVLKGINPTQIDRVEVLLPAQAMIYGFQAKGGAVMFWAKDWTSRISSEPVKTVAHQFIGYNQEKEFYSPNYSLSNNSQIPDYRNTLFWQPDLITDQDGRAEFSFFTSDEPGEYVIHCEGRSDNGVIGVVHCSISTN
ncbi:hypothetical protein SAMN05216331_10863 [Porphyromonadaceae bacterium KH3R12]|nr:hypothetical protein SAMN05216331_10863 [Porphyromonadaceae bacterium KH3R12]